MPSAVGARTYVFALLYRADTQVSPYSPASKKDLIFGRIPYIVPCHFFGVARSTVPSITSSPGAVALRIPMAWYALKLSNKGEIT